MSRWRCSLRMLSGCSPMLELITPLKPYITSVRQGLTLLLCLPKMETLKAAYDHDQFYKIMCSFFRLETHFAGKFQSEFANYIGKLTHSSRTTPVP